MKKTLILLLLNLIVLQASIASAINQAQAKVYDPEYIKALYLINLSQFADWKDVNSDSVGICTIGSNKLNASLIRIVQKNNLADLLKIRAKYFTSTYEDCQILYVSETAEFEISQILYKADQHQIMTVSDTPNFIDRNGTIGFVSEKKSIKIEVNSSLLKKKNILVSSELLEIARRVI